MNLQISNSARKKVCDTVLVSGSARSGTTIVGKLVSSFSSVEYTFEPPLLFSLMPLINTMPEQQWKLLYETYLYEDFFVNAVSGRTINCNHVDDSSIYRVKDKKDIESRLNSAYGKVDAENIAMSRTLAFKMPDVVPFLPRLKMMYPKTRIIIVRRDAVGTLNSLIKKRWFSDESNTLNQIWPYRVNKGFNIPFWVDLEDDDLWLSLGEIDRAAYYYIQNNSNLSKLNNFIEIKYRELLMSPSHVVKGLADSLGLEYGSKTMEIISSIKATSKDRDMSLLERISDEFRSMVAEYSEMSA